MTYSNKRHAKKKPHEDYNQNIKRCDELISRRKNKSVPDTDDTPAGLLFSSPPILYIYILYD